MAQRAVTAPFLKKTYEFVDDRSSDDVVSWSESGTTFVVWNSGDFAKEMLPKFFKHNNFSSFVRQLNTYGFRKTATDKWEFANDNFKRGQKELLTQIRRRKTVTSIQAAKKSTAVAAPSSSLNSGDDLRSSSMSSPASKVAQSVEAPASAHFTELSIENEKLKRHNELLSSEIAQAKKQCGELVAFLSVCEKLAPDQINRIIRQGSYGSTIDGLNGLINAVGTYESDGADDDDENRGVKGKEHLKLFGVWVKGNEQKRGREEEMGFGGANRKEMKTVDLDFDFDVPWRKIVCSPRETSKVCNRPIRL